MYDSSTTDEVGNAEGCFVKSYGEQQKTARVLTHFNGRMIGRWELCRGRKPNKNKAVSG